WRTALIVREIEGEIRYNEAFRPTRRELERLMQEKTQIEERLDQVRLAIQRKEKGYGPQPAETLDELHELAQRLSDSIAALDAEIAPLAQASAQLGNELWGPLMRAGNDKSLLARQMESSADVYTSRVANFLYATPFLYARSARGSLPTTPAGRHARLCHPLPRRKRNPLPKQGAWLRTRVRDQNARPAPKRKPFMPSISPTKFARAKEWL